MFASFGNPQNAGQQPQQQSGAPAPSGGLFGSTNNASQPATGGTSLFGNPQQQAPGAGGGLFGNNAANTQTTGTTGGGLFGSTNTNTQSGGGGGLFGNTNPANTQPGGGGLFGNTNTTNTQPGGGLFGSTNTTNTQTSGGGLFGNASAQPAAGGLFGNQPTAGTSTGNTGNPLFGNAGSTNTTGSGLFGNAGGGTNTTQPSGGLFGNANAPNNTGATGGLFGNTGGTNTNTSGGLFSNNSTNAAPAPSGGLFGSSNTNTTNTGGLFGNNTNPAPAPSGGLFGSTNNAQNQAPGLFGNQPQAGPSTNPLFGGSTLGQAPQQQAPQQQRTGQTQADAQSQFVSLQQRMESIYHAWNPASPQCRFQHYFYNLVDPSQTPRRNKQRCTKKTEGTPYTDPSPNSAHELSNASRLHRAATLQTQLTHRVLKIVQHLHLLIPAVRSSAIRPEEEALRAALEDIDQEIRRPGGTGRIRGKLNELWALVGAVTAARERDRRAGGVEWAVVDEEGLQQLAQILAEEQAGLAHLTKILQKDLKDLAVIQGLRKGAGTGPFNEFDVDAAREHYILVTTCCAFLTYWKGC
ncbi:uncharacterized protein B0H18DRAFT_1108484 [Fomitopsis serialis]|uniref:uncharacterized protein n=1 Tax=Fomitopsis serialis TaxID=139415 RepID=UPI0020082BF8|nr:uncharacterized protein B0H18DRAFT_1108484 [Neoantrodia serialis]KAH9914103.1 hypothetical protein B0H18DRAFT_1108484 [Neoantrodia serialis]